MAREAMGGHGGVSASRLGKVVLPLLTLWTRGETPARRCVCQGPRRCWSFLGRWSATRSRGRDWGWGASSWPRPVRAHPGASSTGLSRDHPDFSSPTACPVTFTSLSEPLRPSPVHWAGLIANPQGVLAKPGSIQPALGVLRIG